MPYLLALILLVVTASANTQRARVIDGDSLELAGEDIPLIGIDAPEGWQLCQLDGREWRCGDGATAALGGLVAGGEVRCDVLGRDRWGRPLAVCFAGALELNGEMVRQGWALAYYPERGALPGPAYDAEQLEAEQAQRGLWSGSFVPPWEWRQTRELVGVRQIRRLLV